MRFKAVEGFRSTEISSWGNQHLASDTVVISDGLACFLAVAENIPVAAGGGPDSVAMETFKWVNTMIGNVKNAIHGTYHAISHKHLPRYLAAFCYRFNRRFELSAMLPRLAYRAVRTPPMPGRLLKLAEAY